MQSSRLLEPQNSDMMVAHSNSAAGKAITTPAAKLRGLVEWAGRDLNIIGARCSISEKSEIVSLLTNKFDQKMAYRYETIMTTRTRRNGMSVRYEGAALIFNFDAKPAGFKRIISGSKVIQRFDGKIMTVPSVLDYQSIWRSSRRRGPGAKYAGLQSSEAAIFGKLGERM